LYIEQIVKKEDYSPLVRTQELGDEFIYYLSDSIDNVKQYVDLVSQSFKIASRVFTPQFFERLSIDLRESCKKILLAMNSALYNQKPYNNIDVYFVAIFKKLKEAYGNTAYEQIQLLNETNTLNKELIRILLAINDSELDAFIIEKIKSKKYATPIKELIDEGNERIIGCMLTLIGSTIKHNTEQYDFIKPVLNSESEVARNKIASWLIANIQFFNKEDCQQLLSNTVFDKIIFPLYTHKTVDKTQDLNKTIQAYYTKHDGNVFFLPKGNYAAGSNQIKIEKSILVSRAPKEIYAKGQNMNQVEMDAVNQYNKQLWTFEHMKVAYAFFELSPPASILGTFKGLSNVRQKGIIFEAYKENFKGILRLSGFQGQGNTLVNTSHYEQSNQIKENIIYREVYQIH